MVMGIVELRSVRSSLEKMASSGRKPAAYLSTQVDAASAAVDTLLRNSSAAISSAIDKASAPFVFSAAQKKAIVSRVLQAKFLRDK